MLEVNKIVADKASTLEGLNKRGLKNAEELIEKVIQLNEDRKSTQGKLDEALSQANNIAKQIGMLMKEGKKEAAEEAKAKTGDLKALSSELKNNLTTLEQALQATLYEIPNMPHESVPDGLSESNNLEVFRTDNVDEFEAKQGKPHWELIEEYDLIDFELGNKITGAGFPVYKGKGARLQRALINFFLDEAGKAEYIEVTPPILVNEASGYGTGQLPDKEGQMYYMEKDNLYLIPTGEVPITNIYRDVIVKAEDLPIKHVGYTPCFRREAGSWGADVRGLNRLHQFDKIEIVQITMPSESYDTLEKMKSHVGMLLEKLGLPYRLLNLCGGDIGFTSALTFDFEIYSSGQKRWLEVSSVSNFESYQANRLKLRYKDENKKSQLLHTLNGSALALPRIIAGILENNQTENGIRVPEVLIPYTGFDLIN